VDDRAGVAAVLGAERGLSGFEIFDRIRSYGWISDLVLIGVASIDFR